MNCSTFLKKKYRLFLLFIYVFIYCNRMNKDEFDFPHLETVIELGKSKNMQQTALYCVLK